MEDLDSIQRRETIFNKLRTVNKEYDDVCKKWDIIHEERDEKRTEMNRLKKLVDLMIEHDCCPVEAQLRFSEELLDDDSFDKCAEATGYYDGRYHPIRAIKEKVKLKMKRWALKL